MQFSTNIEGIEFQIVVERDDQYKSFSPLSSYTIQDLDDLREDLIRIYSIEVTSTKDGVSLKHYIPGVLMSADEEEISEELEDAMADFGIVDHVLKHWNLHDSNNLKPEWAKVE